MAHGEKLAVLSSVASLDKLTQSREIVKNYFLLFFWEIILR
jgi:hypothetical protein